MKVSSTKKDSFLSVIKKFFSAHTSIYNSPTEECIMPKRKKEKIKTLTEEQYNQYLMALKDERPTMLIDKNGKRTPQK